MLVNWEEVTLLGRSDVETKHSNDFFFCQMFERILFVFIGNPMLFILLDLFYEVFVDGMILSCFGEVSNNTNYYEFEHGYFQ